MEKLLRGFNALGFSKNNKKGKRRVQFLPPEVNDPILQAKLAANTRASIANLESAKAIAKARRARKESAPVERLDEKEVEDEEEEAEEEGDLDDFVVADDAQEEEEARVEPVVSDVAEPLRPPAGAAIKGTPTAHTVTVFEGPRKGLFIPTGKHFKGKCYLPRAKQ